jgi:hypothetical protein
MSDISTLRGERYFYLAPTERVGNPIPDSCSLRADPRRQRERHSLF